MKKNDLNVSVCIQLSVSHVTNHPHDHDSCMCAMCMEREEGGRARDILTIYKKIDPSVFYIMNNNE